MDTPKEYTERDAVIALCRELQAIVLAAGEGNAAENLADQVHEKLSLIRGGISYLRQKEAETK